MPDASYVDQSKLIKITDADVKVHDVEFVRAFNEDFRMLATILGVFQPIRREPNTALTYYEVSGTLEDGSNIGEGELVPLSKYEHSKEHIASLSWKKWRKATSLEAISKDGFEMAVTQTDTAMIGDIQKGIRRKLFDFLKCGTGKVYSDEARTQEATPTNLQEALAAIWAQMEIDFESTTATPINFMNPLDIAAYLGKATIIDQTAFGMNYISAFMGMYPTITASDVPQGTIITVPRENLHLYYADANTAGFNYSSAGQTGYVGVYHQPDYDFNIYKTHVVLAIEPFCDYIDKIYQVDIVPGA